MLFRSLDDIAKFIDSNLEVQGQETAEKFEDIQNTVTAQGQKLNSQVESVLETVKNDNSSLLENIRLKLQEIGNAFTTELTSFTEKSENDFAQTSDSLKNLIETQAEHSEVKLDGFVKDLSARNLEMVENIKTQLDEIAKFVDSGLEIQANNVEAKFDEITDKAQQLNLKLGEIDESVSDGVKDLSQELNQLKADIRDNLQQNSALVANKFEKLLNEIGRAHV